MRAAFVCLCLIAGLLPFVVSPGDLLPNGTDLPEPQWPELLEGRMLERLPLSEKEVKALGRFPGHAARFTDGEREIIIYYIVQPSRYVHLVSHCMEYGGWGLRRNRDVEGTLDKHNSTINWAQWLLWGNRMRFTLRETIVDSKGNSWTSPEAWHLAARLGQTSGPWWAYCVAEQPTVWGQDPSPPGAPMLAVAE